MPIINLYSKRKKAAERGNQPEVYQYTDLPISFRRQVVHIWTSAVGKYDAHYFYKPLLENLWKQIHDLLAREIGVFELAPKFKAPNPFEQCIAFLLDLDNPIENLLDLIEITFNLIENIVPTLSNEYRRQGIELFQTSDEAINELNYRFREHGIGYQYENGQIIRIDSYFIHAEAVIPALTLISEEGFIGAEQEFRSAHKHYRNQEYKAAIVDAQKAFESTMKTVCEKFGWDCNHDGDTAAILINTVLNNELIPRYLQSHLSGLKKVLASGVPTVRNKEAGHGQGAEPVDVPEYLAAYVLHLTASNIVLLVEAYKAKCSEITI
jgi:hypothetical protein